MLTEAKKEQAQPSNDSADRQAECNRIQAELDASYLRQFHYVIDLLKCVQPF